MKKLTTLIIALILSIGFFSCAEEEITPASNSGEQGVGQSENGF